MSVFVFISSNLIGYPYNYAVYVLYTIALQC